MTKLRSSLLDEAKTLQDASPRPRVSWFSELTPELQAQVMELCQDFLSGGATKRKFGNSTELYRWLKSKGVMSTKADCFRAWLRELRSTGGN